MSTAVPRNLLALQNRLSPLCSALLTLLRVLLNPQWQLSHQDLQSHLAILAPLLHSFASLMPALRANPMTSYPSDKFDAANQEILLQRLLRKKVLDNVEEWIIEGRKAGQNVQDEDMGDDNVDGDEAEGWAMQVWEEVSREVEQYESPEEDILVRLLQENAAGVVPPGSGQEALAARFKFEATGGR